MEELYSTIAFIQDKHIREALTMIADELQRIKSVQPVDTDTTSLAIAVNMITGKI